MARPTKSQELAIQFMACSQGMLEISTHTFSESLDKLHLYGVKHVSGKEPVNHYVVAISTIELIEEGKPSRHFALEFETFKVIELKGWNIDNTIGTQVPLLRFHNPGLLLC